MQKFFIAGLLGLAVIGRPVATQSQGMDPADPLAISRVLAGKYPAQPIMSYIPALTWSGQIRLAELTGEARWRERAMRDIGAFTSGTTPAIAEPYRLTSLAGALAFADAATLAGDRPAGALANAVAAFMLKSGDPVGFATRWTDDMFMASAVLSRVENGTHAELVQRLLQSYTAALSRPDGLYNHAPNAPYAWGRGNGFALLGLTEALTHLPAAGTAQVLEWYRRHVQALVTHQSDDGSWRQVVDEPTSYRELTVTAMTVAAMSRGIRRGWIDRSTYAPAVERGWRAVAARVNADGTLRDVCAGTGAGETKEYYLNRPAINGADDRGAAMALLAALEVAELRRR